MGDHEMCSNCRRDIPQQNYRIHSLHCARNIALCPDCDEPISRSEMEAHRSELHSLVACPGCAEQVEACKLQDHQGGPCAKKGIICKFCATHVDQGNLAEHEGYCGCRTEKCEECGEFIMLKNWELHINSNHGFIKLKDEPGPRPSWEQKPATKSTNTYSSSSYSSSYLSKYTDPSPSTPAQRANFTATELFNNQDLYSSRRYATSSVTSSMTSSSALARSASSSSSTALGKSYSSTSIVNRMLNNNNNDTKESSSSINTGLVGSKSTSSVLTSGHNSISNNSNNEEGNVMLPCEFCEEMIPMYKLLSHQAECVNPSNVRGSAYSNRNSTTTSSSSYRAYSSLRDSSTASVAVHESASASKRTAGDNSVMSRYLRGSSTSPPSTASRYSSSEGNSEAPSRKISPPAMSSGSDGGSIVSRYTNSRAEPSVKSYLPDSPPSYEKLLKENSGSAHYAGRSTYLREEALREKNAPPLPATDKKSTAGRQSTAAVSAPGMYENDADREGLRQMLSSLRRDPMEVEDDPDNNDGSFFPCEFCGDPYPSEFIMRHQMSCDLNPRPVSSGNGFDYAQIQKSIARNLGIEPTITTAHGGGRRPSMTSSSALSTASTTVEQVRQASRAALSRSNSVIERNSGSGYNGRSSRASSVSRTSSFADRSYGTRTSLARQCSFSIADYSSAVRRSSVFDGYAGYSIYSSISEGLDQITYGGRTSRRNSITEMSYSFSRRGSVSGGGTGGGLPDYPLPALMAALDATKASQEERADRKLSATAIANAHINGQASAYYSRQSSTNDSSVVEASPFGAVLPTREQRHYINAAQPPPPPADGGHEAKVLLMRRKSSIRHSQSSQRLERKVSFHSSEVNHSSSAQEIIQLDENGEPMVVAKPRKKKERTEEEKAARKERKERKERKRQERERSKDRRVSLPPAMEGDQQQLLRNKLHPVGGDLVQQVSAKLLQQLGDEDEQQLPQQQELAPLPPSSLFHSLESESQRPKKQLQAHHHEEETDNKLTLNHATQPTATEDDEPPTAALSSDIVALRENEAGRVSKASSKRNSLDNKSVQSLAKDLAAECAKAYELMESSLSKLTNDFSIGPFGLTPKNKKKHRAPPAPPLK